MRRILLSCLATSGCLIALSGCHTDHGTTTPTTEVDCSMIGGELPKGGVCKDGYVLDTVCGKCIKKN